MSQRKRIGCILDRFDPALDPGNLSVPMGKAPEPPICHCGPPVVGQLGGMTPAIDLETRQVKCRVCRRIIGKGCQRAAVRHLRRLLDAKPEHVDWESIPDLLL